MRSKEIRDRLREIDEYILDQYKATHPEKKRDWRTYEQQLVHRVKTAIKNLEPLIDEATKNILVVRDTGRPPQLSIKQKLTLLLMKELFDKSNRSMASMLAAFSLLNGIDVSYKTLERLYSDPEVEIALHNLHILILKKKGVQTSNAAGDGTGYSLSVAKHYGTEVTKRKDKAKENPPTEGKKFVYSFKLLDLESWLYIAYGVGFRSEKQAFDSAMEMLKTVEVALRSVRLDRYYSCSAYVERFGNINVYVIPKKNATLKGSWEWKRTMFDFVENTVPYLEEYYQRNHSESGFSADKRWFGWKIEQKREDRIEVAIACGNLWHNLFNMYR
ncbi:MAG TPA: ISNCY family transposase [Bdellovibrionales bacterium]|nr:ISNCY family transposase [Bdellovibrionales bacterium]